jgi:hypothetical protein
MIHHAFRPRIAVGQSGKVVERGNFPFFGHDIAVSMLRPEIKGKA